jgi:hypothetical protein
MSGFTLLWSKMLYSSIWVKGSKEDRLLWVTILMMKDKDGVILSSVPGLARMAVITEKECQTSLQKFLDPDLDDSSKVEEGRKLRVVPGGWQVVNHDLYRFSTEEKREFWRKQKAEQREAKAAVADKPKKESKKAREIRLREDAKAKAFEKAEQNGDQGEADRIAADESWR